MSFNEEVKVYAGVEGTGDEEDTEDNDEQDYTTEGKALLPTRKLWSCHFFAVHCVFVNEDNIF